MEDTMAELDPYGKNPHDLGSKLDLGKLPVDLFLESFPHAIDAVTEVCQFGAEKYTRNGWKFVPDGQRRYTSALYRHALAEFKGHWFDDDSELLHAAHLLPCQNQQRRS